MQFRHVLLVLSLIPTAASAQTPAVTPQPAAIDGSTAHVYKSVGDAELRLHVFSPPGHRPSTRTAAVVFFFGGGWTGGTVRQFVPQSMHLAARGMVAIVADYRVFRRHQTSPFEAIADAKSAIRWVRARAADLGVDPGRIAAAGGSAGGHIALSAAVFDAFAEVSEDGAISSKPNALILFNPVVDTTRETSARLKERFGGRGRDASPRHHLRHDLPPMVIFHGKADSTVLYADVEDFCAASTKLGNQCQLVGYDGATHGFFNPIRYEGKFYQETLLATEQFLTKIGYLSARPSTVTRD
jgi:acetyl esterase